MILTVTDLRQFAYCPRVVYFTYCLPVRGVTTYKMEEGAIQHRITRHLQERRTLRAFGLEEGRAEFNVALISERLGLSGKMDMLITTPEGERIPVEFLNSTSRVDTNRRYQLTAYAMLVEEAFHTAVARAFIYRIPRKRAEEVALTPRLREGLERILAGIHLMVQTERIPEPTTRRTRCVDCELRRFCGDV